MKGRIFDSGVLEGNYALNSISKRYKGIDDFVVEKICFEKAISTHGLSLPQRISTILCVS